MQENDLPPSDHVVSLGAVSWQLMELQLVTKPKDRRTIARQQQAALSRQQQALEVFSQDSSAAAASVSVEVLQWECPVQWWGAATSHPCSDHLLSALETNI